MRSGVAHTTYLLDNTSVARNMMRSCASSGMPTPKTTANVIPILSQVLVRAVHVAPKPATKAQAVRANNGENSTHALGQTNI